jgi:hippurate hydrolase
MHACGHDGHTAILLAAAEYLATSAAFDGTLNLIFQPAEESLGGARKMMEDGLFDHFPCDAIFAMHNMPGFRQGQLLLREGAPWRPAKTFWCTSKAKAAMGPCRT